jgi:hypothetical protein
VALLIGDALSDGNFGFLVFIRRPEDVFRYSVSQQRENRIRGSPASS